MAIVRVHPSLHNDSSNPNMTIYLVGFLILVHISLNKPPALFFDTRIDIQWVILCMQICDGLVKEALDDVSTLRLIAMVLNTLHRQSDITKLSVASLSKHPNEYDFLRFAFEAYVK